ncbi:putative monooxygenase (luciferase-like) [Pseudoclavibacter endophyticus]|uniref:LLM class flavin-dependent oxidoreductase n=1 Tax=Pseudoclavibacter endophyticus TaxID=1778590 RepID=A0A6H9WSE0_9MICO|nr:LLM class flavin-dependent oxidoreductase [Pseudoclavibacter endophyticus]KAB1649625.1 LLM class flavin-dependent oxidoreductase [Pseudoclavibacter endophyticus]GGA61135.1 putative monooxygenase (luciferase-like) [Pseudoclavibacter endophyticus]
MTVPKPIVNTPVNKLRFGMFMPPMNSPATQNPTTSLLRDIQTIQLMDTLGFDEVWVGEHHSAGTEIIADPLTFIAHVAPQTRNIKLGTGVVSIPYHNPLMIADRAILVDHLTRGRLMLGVGPGSLPTDAAMLGLEPSELRPALQEDLEVLLRLIYGERVTHKNDRYTLVDAATQLAPYSDPVFDIAVAANSSPAGPMLAGKYGLSMLSVGATTELGFDVLAHHWDRLEEEAEIHGQTADRSRWRMFGPMHIAETKEQAIEDVKYGFMEYCDYTQKTLALPTVRADGESFEERVKWVNETGLGVIGTPDMAIAQIERLMKQSNGGFGCYMLQQHDWANWQATQRHLELFARHVIPAFQPSQRRLLASEKWAQDRHTELDEKNGAAIQSWADQHPSAKGNV